MRRYTQQGIEFLEVDATRDEHVDVVMNGTPVVLIRNNPEEVIVSVIDYGRKPIRLLVNNVEVSSS